MGDATLHDVMAYVCARYPYPDELSKARLTKLVYLADWRMSLTEGHQITDIRWVYNHYGPYVRNIEVLAGASADFAVETNYNAFGSLKETISVVGSPNWNSLRSKETSALDYVMAKTRHLNFTEFLNLVYSTYPIKVSKKYDGLDLPRLADEYRAALASGDSDPADS